MKFGQIEWIKDRRVLNPPVNQAERVFGEAAI